MTHWIGHDVHDVGVRGKPLAAGMAFVIEPGIYIREAALDNLPKTAENAAFIAQVRAAVQKYKDIGVRIEDSFLLTETGLENLSASVPRTLDDVERFMGSQGHALKRALIISSRLLLAVIVIGHAAHGRASARSSARRSRPLTDRTFRADHLRGSSAASTW